MPRWPVAQDHQHPRRHRWRLRPVRPGAMLLGPVAMDRLQPGSQSRTPLWQRPGVDRLRPQPHTRRRDLRGGGTAAGAGRQIPHPGEAFLARALVHLPGQPGQKAVRPLQRAVHRHRHYRRGLRGVRPSARLLPARHANPLQPGDQKHLGSQSPGHNSGPAY